MHGQISRLLMGLLGLGFLRANAETAPAEIRWNELAGLVVGRNVSVPLEEGVVVQGEALSVRDDSLMLDVTKTTGSARYPRGQVRIPRTFVTEVRVAERGGSGGRILGSVLGVLTGVVAGAEIAVHGTHSEAAGVFTFTVAAAACAVGGYYAGRSADRHVRRLRVAPLSSGPD